MKIRNLRLEGEVSEGSYGLVNLRSSSFGPRLTFLFGALRVSLHLALGLVEVLYEAVNIEKEARRYCESIRSALVSATLGSPPAAYR